MPVDAGPQDVEHPGGDAPQVDLARPSAPSIEHRHERFQHLPDHLRQFPGLIWRLVGGYHRALPFLATLLCHLTVSAAYVYCISS
jgi:hypothetical protein